MIVIIDYGGGNLQSVKNALDRLGALSLISDDPKVIAQADKVIFPGQGHFGACMRALHEKELVDCVREAALSKPFLGICVGLQILFERSEEDIDIQGLGIFKGEVRKFSSGQTLPHIGWNLVGNAYYYFSNSYYCAPEETDCIVGAATYGGETFASIIQKDKLLAVQFHPEKSGEEGMKILKCFVEASC